jgi:hypothetical protein
MRQALRFSFIMALLATRSPAAAAMLCAPKPIQEYAYMPVERLREEYCFDQDVIEEVKQPATAFGQAAQLDGGAELVSIRCKEELEKVSNVLRKDHKVTKVACNGTVPKGWKPKPTQ